MHGRIELARLHGHVAQRRSGFDPRLAHYSKCYTYTWFGSALQNTYISCLGHDDASSDSFDGANACAVLPRPVSGAFHAERVLGPLFVRPLTEGVLLSEPGRRPWLTIVGWYYIRSVIGPWVQSLSLLQLGATAGRRDMEGTQPLAAGGDGAPTATLVETLSYIAL